LLISVCEAWQCIIYGEWVKTQVQFVDQSSCRLLDYVYHVSFGRYRPLNCRQVAKSSTKGGIWPPIFIERGYPRFRTYIFKSQSLPRMWLVFVEFRSASSEGSWGIEEEEEEEEEEEDRRIAAKSKSAANYVGRPNNGP